MQRNSCRLAFFVAALAGSACSPSPAPVAATQPSIEVSFSPRGGCTDAVVREIDGARETILVQAYSFTTKPIAEAILHAIQRSVKVSVLLDRSNQTDRYSAATFLKNAGVDVQIDSQHAIAHNKIMIIDDATIITGSFNFTKQAEESNAENLLVIKGHAELVQAYKENWEKHAAHCDVYEGASPVPGGKIDHRRPKREISARR